MFVVKAEDPSLDSLAMCFAVIISQDNLLGDSLLYIYLVLAFKSGGKGIPYIRPLLLSPWGKSSSHCFEAKEASTDILR